MSSVIRYEVDLGLRRQHLVRITLTVPADLAAGALLTLPTWTPGSYMLRDYVHHLQQVAATGADGAPVALTPEGRTSWRLPADAAGEVRVAYELYANELTVRTNHVDDQHALLVGAATFVIVEAGRDRPHEVTIAVPEGERAWSLLPEASAGTFAAEDADHLIDAAFEVGTFPSVTSDVLDVPHTFVWSGPGGAPPLDRLAADVAQIATEAAAVFDGELPLERYTFLCTGWSAGGGGLEHRDGAVLLVPTTAFQDDDAYARFQSLVAHEYLHLWNVKRLTPSELLRPSLTEHVHTRLLWVAEGWTAYYDELIPLRCGLWPLARYLTTASSQLDAVLERPGTALQSVEDASWNAWTKQYVRDENSENAGVDYYSHGAVLAWCLDLLVRTHAPDGDGLDDVVRLLWRQHGRDRTGYGPEDVVAAACEAAGADVSDFFARHVAGREPPPITSLLASVGLEVTRAADAATPDLGVRLGETDAGVVIGVAWRDRPAWLAGVTGGDRLLAIDGHTVERGTTAALLRARAPGDQVELTLARGPRLIRASVVLGEPVPPRRLAVVADPTPEQQAAFRRWTKTDLIPDAAAASGMPS